MSVYGKLLALYLYANQTNATTFNVDVNFILHVNHIFIHQDQVTKLLLNPIRPGNGKILPVRL